MRELQADRGTPLTRSTDDAPAPEDSAAPTAASADAEDGGTAPTGAAPAEPKLSGPAVDGSPSPGDAPDGLAAPGSAPAGSVPSGLAPDGLAAPGGAPDDSAAPGIAPDRSVASEDAPDGLPISAAVQDRSGASGIVPEGSAAPRGASDGLARADSDEGAPAPRGGAAGRRWGFALVALVTIALDLVSKVLVVAKLEDTDHPPVRVISHVLYLVHTRNTGAAFSLGSSYTWILTAIAVGVIVVIIRSARRLASTGWAIALGLILGGACGNVVDRLFREGGGVVDFLAVVDPFDPPWPVFNLADSALCVGVAILVGMELTGRRIDGSRATKAGRAQSKDD